MHVFAPLDCHTTAIILLFHNSTEIHCGDNWLIFTCEAVSLCINAVTSLSITIDQHLLVLSFVLCEREEKQCVQTCMSKLQICFS